MDRPIFSLIVPPTRVDVQMRRPLPNVVVLKGIRTKTGAKLTTMPVYLRKPVRSPGCNSPPAADGVAISRKLSPSVWVFTVGTIESPIGSLNRIASRRRHVRTKVNIERHIVQAR